VQPGDGTVSVVRHEPPVTLVRARVAFVAPLGPKCHCSRVSSRGLRSGGVLPGRATVEAIRLPLATFTENESVAPTARSRGVPARLACRRHARIRRRRR
jgi:hypothetical protein